MNQRRQFGPLLTLEQLHLLLKLNPSSKRFFGVTAPADSLNGSLERESDFRLLSFQQKVWHAVSHDLDCLSRRAVPIQSRPVRFSLRFFRIGATAKSLLAPMRQPRVSARY